MNEKSESLSNQKSKIKVMRFYQRRYLINSRLQFAVLLYSIGVATVVSIANQSFRILLTDELGSLFGIDPFVFLWGGNALMIFAITLFGYYFTNRIAGPMYSLHKHIDAIVAGGEIKEISVRKKDYFQDVMVSYNKLLTEFKNLRAEKSASFKKGI